jgi:hypothetical protein
MSDKATLIGDADLRKKLLDAFHTVIHGDEVTFYDQTSPLFVVHADDDYYVLASVCAAANPRLYPGALAVFPGNYVDEKTFLATARSLNGAEHTDVGDRGTYMVTYKFTISDTTVETVDQPETPMAGLQTFLDNRRDEQQKRRQQHANVKFMLKVTPAYQGYSDLPEDDKAPVAEQKQTVVAEKKKELVDKLQETQTRQLARLAELTKELTDLGKAIALTAAQLKELPDAA